MLLALLLQVMIKALSTGVKIFLPLALIGCGVCEYKARIGYNMCKLLIRTVSMLAAMADATYFACSQAHIYG